MSASPLPERSSHWRGIEEGFRPLYGDFAETGLSVEWHDFRTQKPLDWGQTFRPRSVEFCLNMEGRGAIGTRTQSEYVAGSAGYYAISDTPLAATRQANDRHQFITLEFSRQHLQSS